MNEKDKAEALQYQALPNEDEWLGYRDGDLVGRLTAIDTDWLVDTEGELPHREIGRFDSLAEAKTALAAAVADAW